MAAGKKRVLVFMGMVATGKSYLAQALAQHLGCAYHNSDVVRKEIAGQKGELSTFNDVGKGIYTFEFSRKTYGELLARAEGDILDPGCNCVILDASYQSTEERKRVCQRLGRSHDLFFIQCVAPENVMRKRMEERRKDPGAVSDGRWEVYLEQKKRFEYPVELSMDQLVTLDTDKPLAALLRHLEAWLHL